MNHSLETLLRHDRWVVGGALLVTAGLAWWWILAGAGMGMSALEMTRHSTMNMPAGQPPAWNISYFLIMFSMWWIMMVAMMLPAATPVILLATALNRRTKNDSPPYGPGAAFLAGYLLAWGGFSFIAVVIQWALSQWGWLNSALVSVNPWLSGVLLILAGAWQFSPWKNACLRHCQAPVVFLTQHRRAGTKGALMMGLHHGAYCLGCCWFLMVLLFVGGVMNLYWIIGLTIYVWLEKQLIAGFTVSRMMGILLVIWGGWRLVGAWVGF